MNLVVFTPVSLRPFTRSCVRCLRKISVKSNLTQQHRMICRTFNKAKIQHMIEGIKQQRTLMFFPLAILFLFQTPQLRHLTWELPGTTFIGSHKQKSSTLLWSVLACSPPACPFSNLHVIFWNHEHVQVQVALHFTHGG